MSGGMTPSKDKSTFWDDDVNWFSSKDIKTDELTESKLKITREATQATGLQVYSPGCLVIIARSGILKRTLPVSILRVEDTVNQDLKVLSPFEGGIERYLQIMLRGMTGFILTELVKTGMTVQNLKYEEFEAQPFPRYRHGAFYFSHVKFLATSKALYLDAIYTRHQAYQSK